MKHLFYLFPIIGLALLFCNSSTTTIVESAATEIDDSIQPTGMIAYIRKSKEIRVIDSNEKMTDI